MAAEESGASVEVMEVEIPPAAVKPEEENKEATNGNMKREREAAEQDEENCEKKQKLDEEKKSCDEEEEEEKETEPVSLGPKTFDSSVQMFNYFYNLLHHWSMNLSLNKYEYLVLLDLIKKGHPEPDKKIGPGVKTFEIRQHPTWKSRCFFVIRTDKSVEDFSFRKCVDHILPLPENLRTIKPSENRASGGGGSRGGHGGRRGGRGRGRGRGGKRR